MPPDFDHGRTRTRRDKLIAELAPRYVWWELEGSDDERSLRTLAQIMDLGTYEDIQAIEAVFDRSELIQVLVEAQPGWISPRSWSFWRGRLSAEDSIPVGPPQKVFDVEPLRAGL